MKNRNELLAEVLQPRPPAPMRIVPQFELTTDYQREVLKQEAAKLREIYLAGVERIPYDRDASDFFWDRRVDTWLTYGQLDECIQDDLLLAITKTIFEEARLAGSDLLPTKLATQVEMQITAVDAAKRLKNLLMTQAALAF